MFASLDVIHFLLPSRKDDLIMLAYFIIYFLNGTDFPVFEE